jgi:hypothetical protein
MSDRIRFFLSISTSVEVAGAKVASGVGERLALVTLNNVARISMILDPDGNWIELPRRALIVSSVF